MVCVASISLDGQGHVAGLQDQDPVIIAERLAIVSSEVFLHASSSPTAQHPVLNQIRTVVSTVRPVSIQCTATLSESAALDFLDIGFRRIIVPLDTLLEWLAATPTLQIPASRLVVALPAHEQLQDGLLWKPQNKQLSSIDELQHHLAPHCSHCLFHAPLCGQKQAAFLLPTKTLAADIQHVIAIMDDTDGPKRKHPSNDSASASKHHHDHILPFHDASHLLPTSSDQHVLANMLIKRLKTDRPDGLYSTVVVDEEGIALGMVYSSPDSVRAAVEKQKGVYWSRSRNEIWEKGLTSGASQRLLAIDLDCDGDALRFTVVQTGAGFCHLNRRTCWSEDRGIGHLFRTLNDRKQHPQQGSYTNRLLNDGDLLNKKLLEEAGELVEANNANDVSEVAWEAADLLYFASVICVKHGVSFQQVEQMLDARSMRIRRRPGNAKPDKSAS